MPRLLPFSLLALSLILLSTVPVQAAPALSSRPGAAYTLYLDFDGFLFDGVWGDTGMTPGTTGAAGSEASITNVWARTAEKFAGFDVNVTTVDPSGLHATDYAARQRYYDNTARVMHTVVGGDGAWVGQKAGGVSFIGVAQEAYPGSEGLTNGMHTNWVFPSSLGLSRKSISEASAHENAHALNLNHQGDSGIGGADNREYSSNGGATGNGSYAPIMGNSYRAQRGTWRVGNYYDPLNGETGFQNDVLALLRNNGMTLIDDGIGHSLANATALPFNGSDNNLAMARGFINPLSSSNPDPLGVDNYTKDYFKFTMDADRLVTLNLANGRDWVTPGVAEVGATLRSKLNLFRANDPINPFGFGIESTDTLSSSFTGLLSAGDYWIEVTSFGGHQSTFDPSARYFDMGSYVLSGSGVVAGVVVVPESGTFLFIGLGLIGLLAKRRERTK